jgi:hypothetical protein
MNIEDNPNHKRRLNNINNILKNYNEIDIPDNIILKIIKKFKLSKYYSFLRTEQIELGMMIRTVHLDLNKINTTGIVVNIKSTSSKNIGVITLYNPSEDIYWKINPDKYYIFEVEKLSPDTKLMNQMIKNYVTKK